MAAPRNPAEPEPGEGDEGDIQSETVCRNFRNKQRCRFGDGCRYTHSEGPPIPTPVREPRPRGVCFNWRGGTECKYANRCRFFHGTEAESEAECEQRKVDLAAKAERKLNAENAAATNSAGNDGQPRRARRRPRARRKPLRDAEGNAVCRFFMQGNCREENCSFSHNQPVARAPVEKKTSQPATNTNKGRSRGGGGGGGSDNAAGGGGGGGGRGRNRRNGKKKKPTRSCFKFEKNGDCDYGDECVYQHGEADTRDFAQLKKRKAPGVCYNFKDKNDCTFGERCRYAHDANAPDLREAAPQ